MPDMSKAVPIALQPEGPYAGTHWREAVQVSDLREDI